MAFAFAGLFAVLALRFGLHAELPHYFFFFSLKYGFFPLPLATSARTYVNFLQTPLPVVSSFYWPPPQ